MTQVPYPDTVCKGIAKLDDIKPGVVLWHIYGHCKGEPQKVQILQVPLSYRNYRLADGRPLEKDDMDMGLWILVREESCLGGHYDHWRSLGDCGIGANHNTNRLCLSYEAAMKYQETALEWNEQNPKLDENWDWDI